MDFEQYEKECKRIRKENDQLISDFEKWLSEKKLSSKTINKHASNIDFYVNEFQLYKDALEAQEGIYEIGMFLGYWFIKKAMWSSKNAIKENATSLEKFYKFMYEHGKISKEDLSIVKEHIKEEMPEWFATMDRYDDHILRILKTYGAFKVERSGVDLVLCARY